MTDPFQSALERGAFRSMSSVPGTVVVLPWPPSANSLWRAVKGRNIMSEQYRDWLNEAGQCLALQKPKKVNGPVKITIELTPPNKRKLDIDNRIKATLDVLVKHQVIEADDNSCVREITARWVDNDNECTVWVEAA